MTIVQDLIAFNLEHPDATHDDAAAALRISSAHVRNIASNKKLHFAPKRGVKKFYVSTRVKRIPYAGKSGEQGEW